MPAVVLVGAQWGDEGKGKNVDVLSSKARWVVRFQGGNNAGHTLVVGGKKTVLHVLPSGVLREDVRNAIGSGVVVDPAVLGEELDALAAQGCVVGPDRLRIDRSAVAILPLHCALDRARERAKGDAKIGTTGRGIGPAYEDRAARRAVLLADLVDAGRLERKLSAWLDEKGPLLRAHGEEVPPLAELVATCRGHGERLEPFLDDVGARLAEALDAGERVLFEGAQGALLDVAHGTVPYVTSSHTTAGAACIGTGIGPTRIDRVVGVVKAYTTRVGAGPFPTELNDALGEHLRTTGAEFGATTGRPRRCGWLDLFALAYTVRLNGISQILLNKLDVLTGMSEVALCVGYERDGERLRDFPHLAEDLTGVTPIYDWMPGWREDVRAARTLEELPENARAYIDRIASVLGVQIATISVGPGREETIALRGPWP